MKHNQRFTLSEHVLKWTKKTKKHNLIIMLTITIITLTLLVFCMATQKIRPVHAMAKANNEIQMTYLGNVSLNQHIRMNDLKDTFSAISDILKTSDYSTASLKVNKFDEDASSNIDKNIENIMFLKNMNVKSVNLINQVMDNKQAQELDKRVEGQTDYNFMTGNGSNPINSKTVQQTIKGKKIANVSVTDIESKYTDSLKNTTSVSLEPRIFIPLIKKLKENNDFVVVNADWGIPDERNVTTRQRKLAHAMVDAGADVIVGHNSVIQEVEKYKDSNIFYSLGNVSSQDFLSKKKQGLVVQQNWNGKKTSRFKVTPIVSKSGVVSEAHPSKVEEIKLLNNIEGKDIHFKKENGGYVYEH